MVYMLLRKLGQVLLRDWISASESALLKSVPY